MQQGMEIFTLSGSLTAFRKTLQVVKRLYERSAQAKENARVMEELDILQKDIYGPAIVQIGNSLKMVTDAKSYAHVVLGEMPSRHCHQQYVHDGQDSDRRLQSH